MIKKLFFCFSIFILINLVNLYGQIQYSKIAVADSILKQRGEIYFSFSRNNYNASLDSLISIDHIRKSLVYAYANQINFHKFLQFNFDFQILPENYLSSRLKSSVLNVDSVYPSYTEYLQYIQSFPVKYSNLCQVYEIGKSVRGRKLLVLKISSQKNKGNKPSVLIASSIHGNELTGYKLLIWLMDYLVKYYGSSQAVNSLLDQTDIWIYPLANPDGTYFGGDNSVAGSKRLNYNNVDLNRNYPDPAAGEHPDGNAWQPETQALMKFYNENKIVLSAVLHTGDELINYPWDTWSRLHADNDWYMSISRSYADTAHKKNPEYMSVFNNGIVNGFQWYRITGGQQDYVNYFAHGREVTIELSYDSMPDSISLSGYWRNNLNSLLNFIGQSNYGISGKITDSISQKPLKARIELLQHDKDNSWVLSDSVSGNYLRLLNPGSYTLQISCFGYETLTKSFSIEAKEKLEMNFSLQPLKDPFLVFPNPFSRSVKVQINKQVVISPVTLSVTDLLGRVLFTKVLEMNSSDLVEVNLPSFPDGVYIFKFEAKGLLSKFRIVKVD